MLVIRIDLSGHMARPPRRYGSCQRDGRDSMLGSNIYALYRCYSSELWDVAERNGPIVILESTTVVDARGESFHRRYYRELPGGMV